MRILKSKTSITINKRNSIIAQRKIKSKIKFLRDFLALREKTVLLKRKLSIKILEYVTRKQKENRKQFEVDADVGQSDEVC